MADIAKMKERLRHITERIISAASSCGRNPEEIQLVAVGKTKPAGQLREAVSAGVTALGENYIQEARQKIDALSDVSVAWHFIGHLQSNKAKYAVRMFDLIHSVDSLKLAGALNKEASKHEKVQNILIQVNTSGEETKSGIETRDCMELVQAVSELPHLSIKGLMTMPPFFDQPERARPYFAALRRLRDRIAQAAVPGITATELSMGMTGDFEVAIEEGATIVRIGTALFGERN